MLGPALLIIAGGLYWLLSGRYVSTDDAYIRATRAQISTNVSARVLSINVRDNQHVTKGQLLFRLDPRRFHIALSAAQAKLAAARQEIRARQATWRKDLAAQKAARDTLIFRQRDYARAKKLLKSGIASRAQFDKAQHARDAAQQDLAAARQKTLSALAALDGKPNAPLASYPQVREAAANLADAKLNLSYTVIRAPMSGVVTKVDRIAVGDYIDAGKPQFALISDTDIWVQADYKETDLTYMRAGDKASFTVDAFPNVDFTGRVESLSPGTGSSFSLLPPENASGNWVKVVQRVPVRLSIHAHTPNVPLAAGMSVEVTVDTGHGFAW
ncbi:MAG: HlyD family secretion protein [Alphaproteobacteria bacterium]|nr:HlyD family secretion protein [Alphaproteobacteria bacterium]